MPWTPKQHALFQAAAHNPAIAKSSGIPAPQAAKMANEGVKPNPLHKRALALAKVLKGG